MVQGIRLQFTQKQQGGNISFKYQQKAPLGMELIAINVKIQSKINYAPAGLEHSEGYFSRWNQRVQVLLDPIPFLALPFPGNGVEVRYRRAAPCQSPSFPRPRFRGTGASSGRVG